jgi:ribosomal protein S27AE
MGAKLPRPKAYCPECGTVSVYSEHINRRCAKTWQVEGEDEPVRCEGRFKGAVAPDNWAECQDCAGGGVSGDAPCPRCAGAGWRYVGPPIGAR